MFTFHYHEAGNKSQIKIANKPSEYVTKFRLAHFVTTPTNGSYIQEEIKSR